jgi:hypothetical protein
MSTRETFEAWIRTQALVPARKAGSEGYVDATTQAHWLTWQASWNAATTAAMDDSRCWVPRDLMQRIHRTLEFYANPRSYEAPRIGGVLRGCLRGHRPTPAKLSLSAKLVLRALEQSTGTPP